MSEVEIVKFSDLEVGQEFHFDASTEVWPPLEGSHRLAGRPGRLTYVKRSGRVYSDPWDLWRSKTIGRATVYPIRRLDRSKEIC